MEPRKKEEAEAEKNQGLISHQLSPRESSGLSDRMWRQDWLEEKESGATGLAGLGAW